MKKVRLQMLTIILFMAILLIRPLNLNAFEDQNIVLLDRTAKAFASVIKRTKAAVVSVQVEKAVREGMPLIPDPFFEFFNDPFFERFFGPNFPYPQKRPQQRFRQYSQGSGFFFTPDGYILTNNHVITGADVIKVKLSDGRELRAKIIGTDPQTDLAVLKVDGRDFPYLELGDSDKLEIGEWVIAIGNPFGLQQTVTVGVVSAKGRSGVGINAYEDFIQTDAAINPGNSGGPLLNTRGEVIGINTAIFSKSGGYMGIGFAIPINMAKAVKDQILAKGKVVRGWLGVVIQNLDEDLAKSFNLREKKGVLIADITPNSPAEKYGLKQGDVIVRLNGIEVNDVAELRNRIALMQPGTQVTLDIIRDNRPMTVNVIIAEQPLELRAEQMQEKGESLLDRLGFSVQDLTPQLANQFGYKNMKGVIISEVVPGSPAHNVGLRAGNLIEEVNREPVKNVKEFMAKLAATEREKRVLFRVRSGQAVRYVALSLE